MYEYTSKCRGVNIQKMRPDAKILVTKSPTLFRIKRWVIPDRTQRHLSFRRLTYARRVESLNK